MFCAGLLPGAAALPVAAQSPAATPELDTAGATQLFEQAGFRVEGGRPVNRCGRPSNPRIAFIDINGDGGAEAHIADVDPGCYGSPGAYFAILAQQDDKSWRRLIAEDGIVGFAASRSAGWNDLSLESRDSACPGVRHFDGTVYGPATACAAFAADGSAAAAPVAAAQASGGQATLAPLSGSRAGQLAQLLGNISVASQSRRWDAAVSAFPGAAWQPPETHSPLWDGSTLTQLGTIDLAGRTYHARITGKPDEVSEIHLSSPGNDLIEWSEVESALRERNTQASNIGCHSPTGFGYVALTVDGARAILHKFLNYGTMVPSTDEYSFVLGDPFGGRTEAEVAADRSVC